VTAPHHTVDPKFVIPRQGKQMVLYIGLLDAAHRAGLVAIETDILQYPCEENDRTCIVRATVVFERDPERPLRFTAIGDANPRNVGANIAPHFIRMAETRAKARALRDALNIGMVTAEELGGDEDAQPATGTVVAATPGYTIRVAAPPVARHEGEVPAAIHDPDAPPDARKAALHAYYLGATTLADLADRSDRVADSGLDAAVRRAALSWHRTRLQGAAPAGVAG
jgi:hypothetical protein